jgi:hypothetical protein
MQEGAISRLISYYRNSPKFDDEIERALKMFFSGNQRATFNDELFDEIIEPHFNEWLVFDFKLKNGMTLLEDYYQNNPHKLKLYQLQMYKNLQNNVYGLLEVKKIDIGEGMDLLHLSTGKKYYVKERLATFGLEKGDVFFNRITLIDNNYELIGNNPFKFDIKLTPSFRSMMRNVGGKISPLDMIKMVLPEAKEKEEPDFTELSTFERTRNGQEFDLKVALTDLDNLFEEVGISKMINANLVYKWMAGPYFKKESNGTPIVFIINNLIEEPRKNKNSIDKIVRIISDIFNNSIPDEEIGGKTPAEKRRELGDDYKPSFVTSISTNGKWWKYLEKASYYMTRKNFERALDNFNKTFSQLLKEETTHFEVFRFFANKAVCHSALGNFYLAEKINNLSLKLNKNYDFAIDLKEKIKNARENSFKLFNIAQILRRKPNILRHHYFKELKEKIKKLSDSEILQEYYKILEKFQKEEWLVDPLRDYYNFLKKLEINFESDGLTDSHRITIKT